MTAPRAFVMEPRDRRRSETVATAAAAAGVVFAKIALSPPAWVLEHGLRNLVVLFAVWSGIVMVGALAAIRESTRSGIIVEDDGLWRADLDREANFVPWSWVTDLREHASPYRIDLLDANGRALLTLHSQLAEFKALRELVVERAALPKAEEAPRVSTLHSWLDLIPLVLLATGVVVTLFFVRQDTLLALAILVIICAGGLAMWHTVIRIGIGEEGLELHYPLRAPRRIPWADVTRLALGDRTTRHSRCMVPLVYLRDRKRPIRVVQRSADGWAVYRSLLALRARALAAQPQR